MADQPDEIFFEEDGLVVRRSIKSDVDHLRNNLRFSDIEEIWASHNHTAEEALEISLQESILALTIVEDSVPIGMFGICPKSILGDKATVWLLGSSRLDSKKFRFFRHSKKFIDLMLTYYPYLYNYVDNRNKKSIQWLKFCGAQIGDPVHYGVEKMAFRPFYFERKR